MSNKKCIFFLFVRSLTQLFSLIFYSFQRSLFRFVSCLFDYVLQFNFASSKREMKRLEWLPNNSNWYISRNIFCSLLLPHSPTTALACCCLRCASFVPLLAGWRNCILHDSFHSIRSFLNSIFMDSMRARVSRGAVVCEMIADFFGWKSGVDVAHTPIKDRSDERNAQNTT